jgi:cephalosporin-C deacetylase-like acetyl esterase
VEYICYICTDRDVSAISLEQRWVMYWESIGALEVTKYSAQVQGRESALFATLGYIYIYIMDRASKAACDPKGSLVDLNGC